jgi:hypothetical protein
VAKSKAATASKPVKGPKLTCSNKKVLVILATVKASASLRAPATKLTPDHSFFSASKKESLKSNPPTILVRGCQDIDLTSFTFPLGEPVNWSVKPNQNSGAAPTITPTNGGVSATLKTDKPGSFSVIAELCGTKVIWNVVFVWVKVKPKSTVIKAQSKTYKDNGSNASSTGFESGKFIFGRQAWETTFKVEVIGGGSDGRLGIKKVRVHMLQNGVADTLTGNYAGGGTGKEAPVGSLPVVDAQGPGGGPQPPSVPATPSHPALLMSPFIFTGSMIKLTPNQRVKHRTIQVGDSPGGGFPNAQPNTGTQLQTISGRNDFRMAVCGLSEDAPNAIVAHADIRWQADFAGKVVFGPPNPAIGRYQRTTAKTTSDKRFTLISDGTGGKDVKDAGLEIFGPRFNDSGTTTNFTP